jgi:hypothetical protein
MVSGGRGTGEMNEVESCVENGQKHQVLLDRGRGDLESEARSRQAVPVGPFRSEPMTVRKHKGLIIDPLEKLPGIAGRGKERVSGSSNQSKIGKEG